MSIVIERDVLLAPRTTLGVGGSASYFVVVHSLEEVREAYAYAKDHSLRTMVLGGGSNVVVSDAGVDALVIHPALMDIAKREDGDAVYMTVGAGVLLDDCVRTAVEAGLWGMENLSGIPGSVGAVPIQNVGAYGVEAKDVISEVHVYDAHTDSFIVLDTNACTFGYRDSIFKHAEGRAYFVAAVTFKLSRSPQRNIEYKDLAAFFGENKEPTLEEIRNAVISIRQKKFPDLHAFGTAGSFFKNPIIPESFYISLRTRYPELPGFPQHTGVKIPLGWILDKVLNVRGYREGNVGLFENQALVLVTHGDATAKEILHFSDAIIAKIFDATNIRVEREVVTFV